MPSGDFSRPGPKVPVKNRPPKRKTVAPVTDVQSGGGYHIPKRPPPAPNPWVGPLTPAFPTRPSAPRKPLPLARLPTHVAGQKAEWAKTQKELERDRRARAAAERNRRAEQAAQWDIATAHGLAPPRTITSVGFAPGPPMYIGPKLTGIAADLPAPTWRGHVLSPQQIAADQRRVNDESIPPELKIGAMRRLKAAGIVDPYGSDTAPEVRERQKATQAAYRRDLERAAWELQRIQNANDANIGIGIREFQDRIKRMPTDQLRATVKELSSPENIQRAGLDPTSVGGLILGTASGLSDAARAVTGDSFAGNAAHDVLMWPTWAVPAAYSAVTRPGDFVKGLTQGVIGHAARRDWEGAKEAFKAHPVFSLAEVRGAQALAGRGVAAPVRQVSRGRFLGTQRPPINLTGLEGSRAARLRSYSKEPLTRAGQKVADRVFTRPGLDVRLAGRGKVPARVVKRDMPVVGRVLESRRLHGLERMVDYNRSAGISLERTLREDAQRVATAARQDSRVGAWLSRVLDLPVRQPDSAGYHGVLGKIAAKVAPGLATDPVPMLVSFVLRGVIRHEPHGKGSAPTAKSVADDLDAVVTYLQQETQRPGAFRNLAEIKAAEETIAFLSAVRDSGRGLTRAVTIARKLAPEFKKNDAELIRLKALDPVAAERAPLFPGAMTGLGAKYENGALRDEAGGALATQDIRTGLAARGIDPDAIVHLPHQELGQGAYHKQQTVGGRRNADTNHLTGALWRRGASARSWDHVVDSLVHGRTLTANIQTLDQFVRDLGTKVGDGTWKETVRAAESLVDDQGRPRYQAVRRMSSRLDDDRREGIAKLQQVGDADVSLTQRMLDERLRPPDKDGPDVAVLVPVEAMKQAKEHVKGGATIAAFQALSSGFRQTVLPFSTKWLTGNVAEAILRTLSVTVNPLDRRVARTALDRMIAEDALAVHAGNTAVAAKARRLIELSQGLGRTAHPQQVRRLRHELLDYAPNARAAEAELVGGLFFGQRGQSVRRTAEEMGRVGQTVGFLGRAPIINEFAGMTRWLARKSFALNRVLEREAQYVALGKHVRNEMQELTGRWQTGLRLYEQGIQDVSRGLLGTPAQLKAANWLDETLGRYSRFGPNTRKIIQTYTPFLPWYLNAIRWTMLTIPGKHPIKFALWASAERTFEQDWLADHDDKLTRHGTLATAIKTKDGGWVDAARFTPFGLLGPALGGKDYGALSDVVLPQLSGVSAALRGQDPFGNPLVIPKKYGGTGEKDLNTLGIAAYQGLEAIIPFLSIARRLQEGGETALPTSTVWNPQTKGPESAHGQSAFRRVFDPLRPIHLRAPTPPVTPVPSRPVTPEDDLERRIDEVLSKAITTDDDLDRRIDAILSQMG